LPPHSSTALGPLTRLPGRSRSVSRVPGAAPRTSTPPTVSGGQSTAVTPVRASRSSTWPTVMPRTSVMLPSYIAHHSSDRYVARKHRARAVLRLYHERAGRVDVLRGPFECLVHAHHTHTPPKRHRARP